MSITAPSLHVVVLNYAYDPDLATAEQALDRYFVLTGWSEGLLAAGARVTVLGRFHTDAHVERDGADYHFVADGRRPWLRRWQVPRRLHRRVRACCAESVARGQPTVIHVNGLLFPLATRRLAAGLPPHAPSSPSTTPSGPGGDPGASSSAGGCAPPMAFSSPPASWPASGSSRVACPPSTPCTR